MILIPVQLLPEIVDVNDQMMFISIPNYVDLRNKILKMESDKRLYFPWIGYFALHLGSIVGSAGFKNTPTESRANGEVEIGYEIFEAYRGHGLGTLICTKLIEIAKGQSLCKRLIATTNSNNMWSERVLIRNGFKKEHSFSDGPGLISNFWSYRIDKHARVSYTHY